MSVEYEGKIHKVEVRQGYKALDLSGLGLDDISKIEGLEKLISFNI